MPHKNTKKSVSEVFSNCSANFGKSTSSYNIYQKDFLQYTIFKNFQVHAGFSGVNNLERWAINYLDYFQLQVTIYIVKTAPVKNGCQFQNCGGVLDFCIATKLSQAGASFLLCSHNYLISQQDRFTHVQCLLAWGGEFSNLLWYRNLRLLHSLEYSPESLTIQFLNFLRKMSRKRPEYRDDVT